MLSEAFWKREYGGDASAIGRKMTIELHPFEIIGVTPASFYGLEVGRQFDVAVPICADPLIRGEYARLDVPHEWWRRCGHDLGWVAPKREDGGGRSLVRTLLPVEFPANREKYREFRRFYRYNSAVVDSNCLVIGEFWSRDSFQAQNGTGIFSEDIRELNIAIWH